MCIGGAALPDGYHISVDGKGIFEEVRVKPSTAWPAVEPEAIVVSEGMDVGKSYTDLLKEIEEAHLYIFQLNNALKDLQKQVKELKQQADK